VAGTQPRKVLKHRPWRTTEVEAGPDPAFVKRFHDARFPGPAIGRLRDRRRARREAGRLEEMARAGLPVPGVLGIHETEAGVELRLAWLADARPVEDLLADGSAELAAALGDLLARVHAAGFAYADLHPGNVLVGSDGRAWLVDAAAIRRGSSAARARDLVNAAAAARERTSARFRARFLVAYVRGAPSVRRAEAAALAEAIEGAARIARRERVMAESDRWLRESGACARHVEGELSLLAPRSLSRDEAVSIARCALRGCEEIEPTASQDPVATLRVASPVSSSQALRGLSGAESRGALRLVRGRGAVPEWLGAARLLEHGLAAARPLVLVETPPGMAVLAHPAAGRAPRRDSADDGRALGALAGALWDRGLALRRLDVLVDDRRGAFVRSPAELGNAGLLESALAPWRGRGGADCWTSSAEFVAAFLESWRGSRVQREVLRGLLAAGTGPHVPGAGQ